MIVTGCVVLVLLAVLMMRYNVVIGGQEISKTGKGLIAYRPGILSREGLLAAGMVLAIPMILLTIAVRLFPPWPEVEASYIQSVPK
jgi:predicted membrane protein